MAKESVALQMEVCMVKEGTVEFVFDPRRVVLVLSKRFSNSWSLIKWIARSLNTGIKLNFSMIMQHLFQLCNWFILVECKLVYGW